MKKQNAISAFIWIETGILFIIALAISIFSYFPAQVERFYSVGFYPGLSSTLRILTKWVPFSVGDVIYTLIVIFLVVYVVKGFILIFRRQYTRNMFVHFLFRVARTVLW